MTVTAARDPFRPLRDPWRAIYDALMDEARHRKGRDHATSVEAEVQAVFASAKEMAVKHSLNEPTLEQVRAAEVYARGSIDYGLTWVANLLTRMTPRGTA